MAYSPSCEPFAPLAHSFCSERWTTTSFPMKKTLAIFLFFSLLQESHAQRAVVKMNMSSLVFKNIHVSGEIALLKKFSFQLSYYNLATQKLPFGQFIPDVNGQRSPLRDINISGYGLMPEFRFYLSPIKTSPHGFYLAPYLRYNRFNFSLEDYKYAYNDVFDNNKAKIANVDFTGTLPMVSLGLMIGHQWIIAKHFSIDFWIAGLGFSNSHMEIKASTNDLDPRYFQEGTKFSVDVADYFNPVGTVNISTGSNYVQATSDRWLPDVRGLGINLGLAF